MGFLRYSELLNSERSDLIAHKTDLSRSIDKSKKDFYRQCYWLQLPKLNLNLNLMSGKN